MGNCTGTILKKNLRPSGRSSLVRINLSSAYAAGGDTVPRSILGIGNRLSALIVSSGHTTPGGFHVEVIPGATEYADPKLKVRDILTGNPEVTGNQSAQSVIAEAIATPYR